MGGTIRWLGGGAVFLTLCGAAQAQTLEAQCYSIREAVVACRGELPNGITDPNVGFTIYDTKHNKLESGPADEHGIYVFKAPAGDYVVVIDDGASHVASLQSRDIGTQSFEPPPKPAPQKSLRPGSGGNFTPIVALDRTQLLQNWEAEYTGEVAPVVEKVEDELAR